MLIPYGMMNEGEEYYCHPEIINAFFEEFPLNEEDCSAQYMSSSQDADTKNIHSEIKDIKLENNLRTKSMDFKGSLPRFCGNSQSIQSFLSDEVEIDASRDHQLYFKNMNSCIKKTTTFKINDTVIDNTSIRSMSDVTNNIHNKYIYPDPHCAENRNSYLITLTNETVEDQNNIKFSVFYDKSQAVKSVANQMNKLLPYESTAVETIEENRHKCPNIMPNKSKQTKKVKTKRIEWQNPCYSWNVYHLAHDEFINTDSFLSLMAKGTPIVLLKSINESTAVSLSGKHKQTADTSLYLHGQLSGFANNKNIKYENTLQHQLTKFQLRDEHSLKTTTYVMLGGSDTQKYHIFNINNNMLTSTIKIQQKREECIKCICQKDSNDYEVTVECKPKKCICFNNTKRMNVKQKTIDKGSKKLTFLPNPKICPHYNKELHNFWKVILKTFENSFQMSKIPICNEINMINVYPNIRNTSNSSPQRNVADTNIVDMCNINSHNIFPCLQDMTCSNAYTELQHDLYNRSSDCHISFPMDTDNNFSKILPVQQISCDTAHTELDTVMDQDLMNLIDKEVDLTFEKYKNCSLQSPYKNSPKEVECQTELSLNCNKVYKYQHSDAYNIFNFSNAFQLPGPYHKRGNEVSMDNATPVKRKCITDVSEYQEADIVKWKIDRYLSSNADEANQIVPNSVADEKKYEFNSMELYDEAGVLKDKNNISEYRVCTYSSNDINSVKSTNENPSFHKSLNYINSRRALRVGLSKRANTKRLHNRLLGHH